MRHLTSIAEGHGHNRCQLGISCLSTTSLLLLFYLANNSIKCCGTVHPHCKGMPHGSGPHTLQMKWNDLQARIWGDLTAVAWMIKWDILTCTNHRKKKASQMNMAKLWRPPLFKATTCTWANECQILEANWWINVHSREHISCFICPNCQFWIAGWILLPSCGVSLRFQNPFPEKSCKTHVMTVANSLLRYAILNTTLSTRSHFSYEKSNPHHYQCIFASILKIWRSPCNRTLF